MARSIKSRLAEIDLEEASGFPLPHVEFGADKIAYIDGSKGVIEYNDSVIRLNCGHLILKFSGQNLRIKSMEEDRIILCGNILGFEFFT